MKNRNLVRVDRKKEKRGLKKRISPEIGAGRGNESRHPVNVKKKVNAENAPEKNNVAFSPVKFFAHVYET